MRGLKLRIGLSVESLQLVSHQNARRNLSLESTRDRFYRQRRDRRRADQVGT